ncbi:hypothetical protein F4779DRAFT_612555 [Xylariaceae sp. FL0662B]|nr:hypothetical protein F4779DRAFT_612555 [Xylariaceae sp. FL0662B]
MANRPGQRPEVAEPNTKELFTFNCPAAGMEGDTLAVSSIYLDWLGRYYAPVLDAQGNPVQNADGTTIYQFPEPLREALAAASLRLCAGFEAAEKHHRANWGSSSTKKKRPISVIVPPAYSSSNASI